MILTFKEFNIIFEKSRIESILLSDGFKKDPNEYNLYTKKVSKIKLMVNVRANNVSIKANGIMVYFKTYNEEPFDFKSDLQKFYHENIKSTTASCG